jgi:hypothetical protein
MGLLDKLKPTPRWKHADPVVRLEAIRTLEDPAELALVASSDPDARVRRAAVAKVAEPSVLAAVASGDADLEIRDRAADRLLALALATDAAEAHALAAVRGLADPRRLSAVAKSEAPEAVRADALARITDARTLGAVARHARHASTAAAALDRLTDPEELTDVAVNGEHREVALCAFERALPPAPDPAFLRSIETRAHQKAVAKRARGIIQDMEAAEAARRAAEEERRREQVSLLEQVERLAGLAIDIGLMEAELKRLADAWAALDTGDEAAGARFAQGMADVRATIARRVREAEEAAERARARAEAIATRDALCQRVETLDGDDMLAQLKPIEEEWRSLMPLIGAGPEADRLAERFAQAVAACRKRHELGAQLAEARDRLDALVAEAEGVLAAGDELAAETRWQTLGREARGYASLLREHSANVELQTLPRDAARGTPSSVEGLLSRLEAVGRAIEAREAARRDAALKAKHDLVARLERLAERARRVADAESVTLREGERLMRDIAAGLEEAARTEATREIEEVTARLRAEQVRVAPRVRELREMDEWRRFANAQRQEQLIAMAEAIARSLKSDIESGKGSDLAATARALRELHAKWQEAADAPRQSAQRLWDRFRTATDFIRSRCEGYFVSLRREREDNLQRKIAVTEEAERLAVSSDWARTATRFRELQTAWREIGPVARDQGRDLAQRFRTACNTFFARRREDLVERKKAWADNLARKDALCARAEALAESTDWDAAASEIKRLQAEWKTIGALRRSKSDAVWNRFRAAADRFFERYHHRHEINLANKLAERERMVVELEGLAGAESEPTSLFERVKELCGAWNRSVPIPGPGIKPLADRWKAALAGAIERWPNAFAGSDLDPAIVHRKLEKLVAKVEAYLTDVRETQPGMSQAEILASRLRSALATNAMGGRASEESKWRAAADAVKDAQAAWQRLSVLNGSAAVHALEARFREACRRVVDHARRHAAAPRRPSSSKPTAAAV